MKTYVECHLGKDALAIGLGFFFGLVAAYAFELRGVQLLVGAPVGALMGYLARMLMEPERVKWAAKTAWRKTTELRPKPDWRERIVIGVRVGLATGGIGGILISVISVSAVLSGKGSELPLGNLVGGSSLLAYCASFIAMTLLAIPLDILLVYCLFDSPNSRETIYFVWFAKNFNAIAIHYHAVRFLLIGLYKTAIFLEYIPAIVKVILKLTKTFLLFVHSDHFSACGSWAAVGVIVTILTVPLTVPSILISSVIGGLVGAGMRQVVLMLLAPEN